MAVAGRCKETDEVFWLRLYRTKNIVNTPTPHSKRIYRRKLWLEYQQAIIYCVYIQLPILGLSEVKGFSVA